MAPELLYLLRMKHIRIACVVAALVWWVPSVAGAASPRLTDGSTLQAITEVTLRGATLIRGSKVRVLRFDRHSADVELADGHVLRAVPLKKLIGRFRITS